MGAAGVVGAGPVKVVGVGAAVGIGGVGGATVVGGTGTLTLTFAVPLRLPSVVTPVAVSWKLFAVGATMPCRVNVIDEPPGTTTVREMLSLGLEPHIAVPVTEHVHTTLVRSGGVL
jgi:hypothetical protein